MDKILLTGASGFIGTHVRKTLWEAGYELISLVRTVNPGFVPYPSERLIIGTLAEADGLEQNLSALSPDACVHLAWEGIPDYSSEPSIKNLEYGFHILRLCQSLNIKKLIISGSCWEYLTPSGLTPENAACSYENPFKIAKNTLHAMAEAFCQENGISFHWLRLFYVYGEGQRPGSLLAYITAELKKGVQPALNGAFNRNDFIHASDVAQAVRKSLEYMQTHTSCATFNIGSGHATQVLDIVSDAARILNLPFDTETYRRPDAPPASFWADIHAAKNCLGWEPQITLSEGIERFIQSENGGRI